LSVLSVLSALRQAGLHGRWAIIGAVARNAWAPPRATTDLDVTVVAERDTLLAVASALESSGYVRVREQRAEPSDPLPDILIFRSEDAELRQVDVLIAKTSFEDRVLRCAESLPVGDSNVPVAFAPVRPTPRAGRAPRLACPGVSTPLPNSPDETRGAIGAAASPLLRFRALRLRAAKANRRSLHRGLPHRFFFLRRAQDPEIPRGGSALTFNFRSILV